MDSDDDFLIDDDEDIDSGVKDELYDLKVSGSISTPPAGQVRTPSASNPASSATSMPNSGATQGSTPEAPHSATGGASEVRPAPHVLAPGTAAPALVVAPKALSTANATTAMRNTQQQQNQPQSTADVLRGLQEGGNALLKKLGGFFQSPGSYLPAQLTAPGFGSAAYDQDPEVFFAATFAKFVEALQGPEAINFPVLDDFITDFNAQESLRFDGSDLIEKQERDYFGLREKRLARLEALVGEGKEIGDVTDEEASIGIREQEESRDKAVADGEYQTGVLRDHQSSRGQMFQNIVLCAANLFGKLLLWPGATEREIAIIPECIEEYLIPHIQKKLYCPDRWTDWRFAQLVGSTQFVQPSALEIQTPIDPNLINRCGALLVEVNFLPTPRKKLSAIAQACKHIVNYLADHPINTPIVVKAPSEAINDPLGAITATSTSTPATTLAPLPQVAEATSPETLGDSSSATSNGSSVTQAPPSDATTMASPSTQQQQPSARQHSKTDEFLAVLIYVLIQTNPPNLLSNVAYLITCRSSSDSMLTDEGYFFAHVAIAVHYLCKLKESKSSSKVDLEGGVILLEPEWMPMVLDKEARLLHLLPSLNTARAANEILEYKSTIRRLALEITRKIAKKKEEANALSHLISQYPSITYTPEQIDNFSKDPSAFFADHRYWNSAPEDFKSPAAIAHLLAEYKKLLMNEYRRASNQTSTASPSSQ